MSGRARRTASEEPRAADTSAPAPNLAGWDRSEQDEAGTCEALPFLSAIQASFGRHDVGGARARVGGLAADRCDTLGAHAYSEDGELGFGDAPDLETAAHEAAHYVQDRGVPAGDGPPGDVDLEANAEAVAARVVRGEPAEDLLDGVAGAGHGTKLDKTDDGKASGAATRGDPLLEPLEFERDTGELELGNEYVRVAFSFGLEASLIPDDFDPVDGTLAVKSRLAGNAHGEAEASLEHEKSKKASDGQKGTVAVDVGASGEASASASFELVKRVDAEQFKRDRKALQDVVEVLTGLFDVLAELRDMAGDEAIDTAPAEEQLARALEIAEVGLEGMALGAELVGMLDSVADALVHAAEGAITFVEAGSGDPAQARDLGVGESMCMTVNADAEYEAHAKGGAKKGKNKLKAGYSTEGTVGYTRVFQVDGVEDHGRPGVVITVTFLSSEEESSIGGAAVNTTSLTMSEAFEQSSGHILHVRLFNEMPEFDQAYDAVFSALTPNDLVALTQEPWLQYQPGADDELGSGITRLELSEAMAAENATSTFLGDDDTHGLFMGGAEGDTRSRCIIDYESGTVAVAEVDARAENGMTLNVYDNAAAQGLRGELDELLGFDPFAGMTNPEFTDFEMGWTYDGEVASLNADYGDTLDEVLSNITVIAGQPALQEIMARAASSDDWNSYNVTSVLSWSQRSAWEELGEHLAGAQAPLASVDGGRGKSVGGRDLRLQVRDKSGKVAQVSKDGKAQPWIPPGAEVDWSCFLCAQLIGDFVAVQSGPDKEGAYQALMNMRDVFYGQDYWSVNEEALADEVGVEVEGDFAKLDGSDVEDADWYSFYQARAVKLTDRLERAAEVARADQEYQLERQQETGAAKDNQSDPDLIAEASGHLAELSHAMEQVRSVSTWDLDNTYSETSMLRFLQQCTTPLTLALSTYRKLFGVGVQVTGYAVTDPETGEVYDFSTETTGLVDSELADDDRVALSQAAGDAAANLDELVHVIDVMLDDLPGLIDEPEDFARVSKNISRTFIQWDEVWRQFKALYAAGGDYEPARACEPEEWAWAFDCDEINRVVDEFDEAKDSFYDTGFIDARRVTGGEDPRYEQERDPYALDRAQKGTVVEIDQPPRADDQFFEVDMPAPDGYPGTVPRTWSEVPEDAWLTIPTNESLWGLTSDGKAQCVAWAAQIAHALSTQPEKVRGKVWVLEGHTDATADPAYNDPLSWRRALAMRDYIIQCGVPAAVLVARGHGERDNRVAGVEELDAEQMRDRAYIPRELLEGAVESAGDWWALNEAYPTDDDALAEARRLFLHQLNRRVEVTSGEGAEGHTAAPGEEAEAHPFTGEDVVLFTAIKLLLGTESLWGVLMGAGRTDLPVYQRAAEWVKAGHLTFPTNEMASADDVPSSMAFQPGILSRDNGEQMTVSAKVRSVADLDLGYFGSAHQPFLLTAVKVFLVREGAGFEVVGPGVDDRYAFNCWTLDGGTVTGTIQAVDDGSRRLLDRTTGDVGVFVTAGTSSDPVLGDVDAEALRSEAEWADTEEEQRELEARADDAEDANARRAIRRAVRGNHAWWQALPDAYDKTVFRLDKSEVELKVLREAMEAYPDDREGEAREVAKEELSAWLEELVPYIELEVDGTRVDVGKAAGEVPKIPPEMSTTDLFADWWLQRTSGKPNPQVRQAHVQSADASRLLDDWPEDVQDQVEALRGFRDDYDGKKFPSEIPAK